MLIPVPRQDLVVHGQVPLAYILTASSVATIFVIVLLMGVYLFSIKPMETAKVRYYKLEIHVLPLCLLE